MNNSCTRVYLLRHGETSNYKGKFRYNGQNDVDVTDEGVAQLVLQARRLNGRPIRGVYSSDLKRSYRGAQEIASLLSSDVIRDSRLREISAGRWEALTVDEVLERYPEEFELRFSDIVNYRIKGGGENLLDVQKRSRESISEIVNSHRGEEVAIVAHGGVNRIILSDAMGLNLENILRIDQDFGCLNIIEYYDSTAVVKLLNLKP